MEQGWRKLRFDKNHVSCTRPFCRPPEVSILRPTDVTSKKKS